MIPPASTPKGNALPVPLSALSVDNVAPAVGEETEVPLKIRIERIEGDKAYVTPLAINGEPVNAGAPEPDEDDEMRRLAESADDEEMA